MKKYFFILLFPLLFSGCAMVKSPVNGLWYTNVKAPLMLDNGKVSSKVGQAEAQSILGIVAIGDASITTAAQNGGITDIHYIDYESESILGIVATFRIYVYGE